MKARVKWLDHMSFVGESESGHSVVMDSSPDSGGRNLGTRPMEMVLLGLGGCSAIDVRLILQKSRQHVTDIEVELDAERADDVPAVFTGIRIHYRVKGRSLDERRVGRAVSLSSEKYCSVSRMLEASVKLDFTWEIVEETEELG
ncbi:MAG: peroxiredoxin [Gammaproteobacteria bacterium]|nr:MAG: peroxiredoxin [Gammaproteobacteria bacterium]PIE36443.1 MAG: peroxiredoxin [Gammaproteobacteria bacterium]